MEPIKSPPHEDLPTTDLNPKNGTQIVPMADNHVLKIDPKGRYVVMENVEGAGLRIEITPNGPVLKFDAPMMKIENSGDLCLEGGNIALRSRGDMVQEIGGDYLLKAAGDFRVAVRDDAQIDAQAIGLDAQRGELSLRATDDVALNGLRILHNVPTEEEIIEQYSKVKTFGDYMACPAVDPKSPQRMPKSKPVRREEW